jgi:alcohol dehydrogenase class IV
MTTLVCSKSTRKFFPEIQNVIEISTKLTKDILKLENSESEVIAVGGGAVQDAAKIISKDHLISYPTTASGSPFTHHSVVWDGPTKLSIKSRKADIIEVKEEFLDGLSEDVLFNTKVDVFAHCYDSKYSKQSTIESIKLADSVLEMLEDKNISNKTLVEAGNIGGQVIAMAPTTLLHSLSYPMTGYYGISHGRAMGMFIMGACDFMGIDYGKYFDTDTLKSKLPYNSSILPEDFNTNFYLNEVMKYDKIHVFDSGKFEINTTFLRELTGL